MCDGRKLFFVRIDETVLFPSFQFHNRATLPSWDTVLNATASSVHPLAFFRFMTLPSCDLVLDGRNLSPCEWLLTGCAVDELMPLLKEL